VLSSELEICLNEAFQSAREARAQYAGELVDRELLGRVMSWLGDYQER